MTGFPAYRVSEKHVKEDVLSQRKQVSRKEPIKDLIPSFHLNNFICTFFIKRKYPIHLVRDLPLDFDNNRFPLLKRQLSDGF